MRYIPSSILDKINKQNQTIYENANPKMNVAVARARTSVIDSTYWTVETIREGQSLGDISLAPRRFKTTGSPNRIYEIHVDNGIVKTSIREYPDKAKNGWKHQFTLGAGASVGIAFNGHWERYRRVWRLVTDEKPWITWVDNNTDLWCQHWDDVSTLRLLDTGVKYAKAIRAWKNVEFADDDQGIIVGYIKTDGTLWYRSYCQQEDISNVWEGARQVTDFPGTAVSLNMFLTNDYRMGFIIEDSNKNIHWIMTERNWAGMAIQSEVVVLTADAKIDFLPLTYWHCYENEKVTLTADVVIEMLFGRIDNTLTVLENIPMTRLDESSEEYQDWGYKVKFRLNYETMTMPNVSLTDVETGQPIEIKSVTTVESGYEYEVLVDDTVEEFGFNGLEGNLEITVTNIFNEAGTSYDLIVEEFAPTNLNPPDLPLPEVELIWNE